jgi:hypothetical protein
MQDRGYMHDAWDNVFGASEENGHARTTCVDKVWPCVCVCAHIICCIYVSCKPAALQLHACMSLVPV